MGFWHTGYMEFHEPTGLSWTFTPEPVLYFCSVCGIGFNDPDQLLRHRFEAHPHRRPMLFVRGQELGATPHRIARAVTHADFVSHHALDARVHGERVAIATLGDVLAAQSGRVMRDLENKFVPATFEIDFSIANH